MRLGLSRRWPTENQRFFLSSQQRARAAGRSLLPSEPGEAAWVQPDAAKVTHRPCRGPRHLTEEGLLCATPLLLLELSTARSL
jgi:hypothetical protein